MKQSPLTDRPAIFGERTFMRGNQKSLLTDNLSTLSLHNNKSSRALGIRMSCRNLRNTANRNTPLSYNLKREWHLSYSYLSQELTPLSTFLC